MYFCWPNGNMRLSDEHLCPERIVLTSCKYIYFVKISLITFIYILILLVLYVFWNVCFLDVGRCRDRIAQCYYNTRVRSLLLEFILNIYLTFEILFLLLRPFTDCKTWSRKYLVSEILRDFLTAEKYSWSDWLRLAPQLNRFRNPVITFCIIYAL